MTTAEAAQLLRRDVSTVGRMARAGQLRVVKKLPGVRGALLLDGAQVRAMATERIEQERAALAAVASQLEDAR